MNQKKEESSLTEIRLNYSSFKIYILIFLFINYLFINSAFAEKKSWVNMNFLSVNFGNTGGKKDIASKWDICSFQGTFDPLSRFKVGFGFGTLSFYTPPSYPKVRYCIGWVPDSVVKQSDAEIETSPAMGIGTISVYIMPLF